VTRGHEIYRATQTQTATGAELVVMLYEGAIRFLQQALHAIEAEDTQGAHNALIRAQRIVEELQIRIDRERGPVADGLNALYAFMLRELEAANAKKDRQRVLAAIGLLNELLTAWRQAARQPVVERGVSHSAAAFATPPANVE